MKNETSSIMNKEMKHEGVYEAVLFQLSHFAIPQAQALKKKVERDECLNDFEIEHLKDLINTALKLKQILIMDQRNEQLSVKFISLLNSISSLALLNEQINAHKTH